MSGVRVRGDRIQVDFYYRGVRCRETLPLRPTPENLLKAAQKREAVLYAINNGAFEYEKFFPTSRLGKRIFASAGRVTVADLLNQFMQSHERTIEFSTLRDYQSAIRCHLVPAFGGYKVNDLRPSDVREWISTLSISGKRINNILIPLRRAFQDAVADGLIQTNPVTPVPNMKLRAKDPDPFSLEEMRTILDQALGVEKWFYQFAFWTGLRTSELIALTWPDIDHKRGVAVIRRAVVRKREKAPKTASGAREVKLLPQAEEALRALETAHQARVNSPPRVFMNPRTGKPWETDGQIRKTSWKPLLKRAGVRYRYPYQTRHTYASMMLSAGENPMWVAQQMGHKDWGMIRKTYGRWIPDANPSAGQLAESLWSQHGHRQVASG